MSDDKSIQQEQPSPTSPKGSAASAKSSMLADWAMILVVAILVGAAVHFWDGQSPSQKMLTIDTTAIIEAKVAEMKSKSMDEVEKDSKTFGLALKNALNEYSANGYFVINARNMAAFPKESDVTRDVAAKLGVNMDANENTAK